MNIADELQKLQQLRDSGGISDEEFAQAKAKLLATPPRGLDPLFGSGNTEQQTRQWAMILHLSQFAVFALPLVGYIVPIVIWQIQKDKMPGLDQHGKIVANWIISQLIYWVVAGALVPVFFIGVPLLMVLGVLVVVYPIIGGIKANGGEAWKYPGSIPFFK